MTFCWLVELFEPSGNSMGCYHTGFTGSCRSSRTTRDPNKARRYATRVDALKVCVRLLHMKGVWRAVEHGFGDNKTPTTRVTGPRRRDAVAGRLTRQFGWRKMQQ